MTIGNTLSETIYCSNRIHLSTNIERLYRRFYSSFKTERTTFLESIQGISPETDRECYASLMLNRLMFLYFLQKKGFLDNDTHYLSNHLQICQNQYAKATYDCFYRHFLLRLFHEGLCQQSRSPGVNALLGKVPYLKSSLFNVHTLEFENNDIQIPDEAFERLFAFFDMFQWHLEKRSLQADNEINPDVLGYIFEKYDNQKQLGAYYTKQDISEYIAKNTIIPFLYNAVEKRCPAAFQPGGPIWQALKKNPDRYIYPALKKGVELPLPSEIAVGLNDISKRSEWNRAAPAAFALPTETWREVVARRTHYEGIRAEVLACEVYSIDDFVTYNLDICQFAQDVIENCDEPELLYAFYDSLSHITVLDPTCGSGAFLFAALGILEALYEACLDRMHEMPPLGTRKGRPYHIFDRLRQYPRRRYYILKSIIENNLYGVDIMEEAVEMCKLRLFLMLVAENERVEDIEGLSDIDFNIRAGNTLVGSAEEEAIEETIEQNQRPFHWFVEFNRVMKNGGFDVIIGNPPYVEYEKVSEPYKLSNYSTRATGNLYALTVERCSTLLAADGRFGMIIPASATCTDGYLPLQKILLKQSALHISSYSDQRGKLFDIPHPRLSIILYQKRSHPKRIFSTPYLKLGRELRASLFQRLGYIEVTNVVKPGVIPRYGSAIEQSLHTKLHSQEHCVGDYTSKYANYKVYYTRKLSWFVQVTPFVPRIEDERGSVRNPSELKTLCFSSPEHADIAFVALNSNLFYWFVTVGSDCRNLNMREVLGLPLSINKIACTIQEELRRLAAELAEDLQAHSEHRKMHFKGIGALTIQCIFPGKSRAIIDEIDCVLARYYGFTEEELDFIINYDLKYRIGVY